MHSHGKLGLAICLGLAFGRLGGAEISVRAAAWWINPEAAGFSTQIGSAFEVGGTVGVGQRHIVSVEVAHVPWKMDARFAALAPGALLGSTGSGHLTPVLGSYRFYLRDSGSRWRPFLSASAGATKVDGRIETFLSGVAYGGDLDRWVATFAGAAGMSVALAPRVSVEVGYRYLQLAEVEYGTMGFRGVLGFTGGPGPTGSFAAKRNHIGSLGVGFRF